MIISAKKRERTSRVYDTYYHRYIHPKYTIANEIRHSGEGIGIEYFRRTRPIKTGEALVDSAFNIGKTALNLAKDNEELISAVGSIAGAVSQISRAQESAKQLAAIQTIKDIRNQMSTPTSTPTSAPTSSATISPEKIEQIKKNFSGRGVKKMAY